MSQMGWDIDCTLGKLHRFWYWCVDFCEDGDLRKYHDSLIAGAVGVATVDAKRLVEAMVQARWLDRQPYFRVHDWWDYIGRFLQVKYRNYPHKWQRIKSLYEDTSLDIRLDTVLDQITDQPNLTNLTNQPTDPRAPDLPAELPHRFPVTIDDATAQAEGAGVPIDFVTKTWNKAVSRGGNDAKGQQIRSWKHYVKSEWNYELDRRNRDKNHAGNGSGNRTENPRNVGTCETRTDYREAVRRKEEKRLAGEVAKARTAPEA